jgi:hypothetical protein
VVRDEDDAEMLQARGRFLVMIVSMWPASLLVASLDGRHPLGGNFGTPVHAILPDMGWRCGHAVSDRNDRRAVDAPPHRGNRGAGSARAVLGPVGFSRAFEIPPRSTDTPRSADTPRSTDTPPPPCLAAHLASPISCSPRPPNGYWIVGWGKAPALPLSTRRWLAGCVPGVRSRGATATAAAALRRAGRSRSWAACSCWAVRCWPAPARRRTSMVRALHRPSLAEGIVGGWVGGCHVWVSCEANKIGQAGGAEK